MSLEKAIQENTAALLANTAALTAKGAATPAVVKPSAAKTKAADPAPTEPAPPPAKAADKGTPSYQDAADQINLFVKEHDKWACLALLEPFGATKSFAELKPKGEAEGSTLFPDVIKRIAELRADPEKLKAVQARGAELKAAAEAVAA